jgi:4-hydroxybenzoate polyprenyltransferase/phosphoserine phosphatase
MSKKLPVVVDLDGTFFARDVFWSQLLALFSSRSKVLLKILYLLAAGKKAEAKTILANRFPINLDLYPKNEKLYMELQMLKKLGHEIVLCSGAAQLNVNLVVQKFPVFTSGYGSGKQTNLTGRTKASFLVQKYGEKKFIYFGDSRADRIVNRHANLSQVVHAYWDNQPLENRLKQKAQVFFRAIRIKHWAKNLLVFAPLAMAHKLFDLNELIPLAVYFVAFGFVASGTYLLNDLIDLHSDSQHKIKRNRPIASGAIPIPQAIVLALGMTGLGLVATAMLSLNLLLITCLYLILTFSYMLVFKRIEVLDVVILAGLYVQRVIAGFISTQIAPTFWFLAFTLFLFFSLALLKRYTETSSVANVGLVPGRGYYYADAAVLLQSGIASSFTAVLILSLYLNSEEISMLYSQPFFLWLTVPIMLYWTVYLWLQATRGKINEDPIDWAVSDRFSLLSAMACAALILVAT